MLALLLMACRPPAPACSASEVAFDYDPSNHLGAWPDDVYTTSGTSPTGLRISLDEAPWVHDLAPIAADLLLQSEGSSGFATQGETVLRFTGALEPLAGVAAADAPVELFVLDGTVRSVPIELRQSSDRHDLFVRALEPLALGTRHAVVVGHGATADGQCIAPGPVLAAALDAGEHDETLSAVGREPSEIGALVTFTTHADHQPFLDAAAMASTPAGWGPWSCGGFEAPSQCETSFEPEDFREPDGVVDSVGRGTHTVPVTWWLPDGVPAPVVVLGHGLSGGRDASGMQDLAARLNAGGFAAVAIDALAHNEHPTSTGSGAIGFLGLDLASFRLDGAQMQANFQQSILERHQLVSLVRAHPDLDGDGLDDVDSTRIGYYGISLGAMLGTGLLAVDEHVEAAVLQVGGGELISIVRDSEVMADLLPLLAGVVGSDAELDVLLTVAQTLVDPADPALWGTFALDGDTPDVLLQLALEDEVVPPAAGRALARGFGLPQVGTVEAPVPGLLREPGYPVQGNHGSGATVGLVQYAEFAGQPAMHGNTPGDPGVNAQAHGFLETWIEGATAIRSP